MTADRLREVLGAEPPLAVRELSDEAQAELAALVTAARAKQAADLEQSFAGVLKHVPFPVRPIVRKMLRG